MMLLWTDVIVNCLFGLRTAFASSLTSANYWQYDLV